MPSDQSSPFAPSLLQVVAWFRNYPQTPVKLGFLGVMPSPFAAPYAPLRASASPLFVSLSVPSAVASAPPVGESKLLQIAAKLLSEGNCRPDTGQLLKILIQKLKQIKP